MIGGGFLGGGISIVPAGKAIIYASMTTEDGANIPNAVFKATRTGSTVTVNGSIDGRAELLVDAGHTYTVTVTPAGGSYLNRSQTVVTASAKSYAVKFYLYPAKANEASTTASLNALNTSISTHVGKKDNPHNVTKAQVGLGAYPTSPADIGISTATQTALDGKVGLTGTEHIYGFKKFVNYVEATMRTPPGLKDVINKEYLDDRLDADKTEVNDGLALKADKTEVTAHTERTDNPHSVTKAQVGLGAYPASPADIGISTATQTALNGKVGKTGNEDIAGIKNFTDQLHVGRDGGSTGQVRTYNAAIGTTYAEITGGMTGIIGSFTARPSGLRATHVLTYEVQPTTSYIRQSVRRPNASDVEQEINCYLAVNSDGEGWMTIPMRNAPMATDAVNYRRLLDAYNEIVGYVDDQDALKQDKFKLYQHNVHVYAKTAKVFSVTLTIINTSSTPITSADALLSYLGAGVNDYHSCSGMFWSADKTTIAVATGIRGGTSSLFALSGVNMSSGINIYNMRMDLTREEVTVTGTVREIL